MASSEELIGTTEYVTLYTRCCINRCRYNGARLYVCMRECVFYVKDAVNCQGYTASAIKDE